MTQQAASRKPMVISMGDPAGIGPEIIWRAWQRRESAWGAWCVIGHASSMARAAAWVGLDAGRCLRVAPTQDWGAALSGLNQADEALTLLALDEPDDLPLVGELSARAGRLAALSIEAAIELCLDGQASAMVTAPIHKQALAMAGWDVPGHTELLQHRAAQHQGREVSEVPVRMMLANSELQTVLHSIHVSLRDALDAVTLPSVEETIAITHAHVHRLDGGAGRLRIALAGVNPHAGEGGRFGREELEILQPAVEQARRNGWDVSGPWAPDTVFMRARAGEFDVVIAMYHDQGLIPVKYLGVDHGVNVTLGLPFVRTSPDHGTAMDLAGLGVARADSLCAAIADARRRVESQRGGA